MAHHKNIIDKGSNYTRSKNKGSFVTIIHKMCDRIFSKRLRKAPFFGMFRKLILTTLLFSVVGCGSKKKTVEITKEERHEKKDQYIKQLDSLKQEIEYRNAIIQLSIEPVDPKLPNKAKFTRTEKGFEYEGENSKMGASSQKEEKEVRTESGSQKEETDKGEVKERKKEKNQYKEKQIQILWWQWIILIVGFSIIGLWVYFRATGKRIRFW